MQTIFIGPYTFNISGRGNIIPTNIDRPYKALYDLSSDLTARFRILYESDLYTVIDDYTPTHNFMHLILKYDTSHRGV